MITEDKLKSTFQRIEDLKIVRKESWVAWHVLNNMEQRTKEEGKEQTRLSTLITSLNYEIVGLQKTFKEDSEEFIKQIVGSK